MPRLVPKFTKIQPSKSLKKLPGRIKSGWRSLRSEISSSSSTIEKSKPVHILKPEPANAAHVQVAAATVPKKPLLQRVKETIDELSQDDEFKDSLEKLKDGVVELLTPTPPEAPTPVENIMSPAEIQVEYDITAQLIQTLQSAAYRRPDLLDDGMREHVAEGVQKTQTALAKVTTPLATYKELEAKPPPRWGEPSNTKALNAVKTSLDGLVREMIANRKVLQILMDVIAL
jgi:hypothetical protein